MGFGDRNARESEPGSFPTVLLLPHQAVPVPDPRRPLPRLRDHRGRQYPAADRVLPAGTDVAPVEEAPAPACTLCSPPPETQEAVGLDAHVKEAFAAAASAAVAAVGVADAHRHMSVRDFRVDLVFEADEFAQDDLFVPQQYGTQCSSQYVRGMYL